MHTRRDESSPTPTLDTPALLPLPDPATLSEPRLRGGECVWGCGTQLTGDTAVDLGERISRAHGTKAHWFPRACRRCAADAAYAELKAHTRTCEQCVDDVSRCETGMSLNRVMRRNWR